MDEEAILTPEDVAELEALRQEIMAELKPLTEEEITELLSGEQET